jgi:hypothetical protein
MVFEEATASTRPQAAKLLGSSRRTLANQLSLHGFDRPRKRKGCSRRLKCKSGECARSEITKCNRGAPGTYIHVLALGPCRAMEPLVPNRSIA